MSWHKLSGQLLLVALVATSLANERVKRQTSTPPEQPRIVTNDGHLLFQTGANHNISFQSSSGGSVMIDGQDVKQMATTVQDHTSRLNNLQSLPDQVRNNAASITSHSAFANSSISQLNTNYATLNRKVAEIEGPANETRYQLDSLTRSLNNLTQILLRDECATGPCQHAGTCIDMFDTYRCLCPTTWQGPRCEVDVNECSVYQGTQHGCASGSTCHNTNGGFSCLCPTGRTGVLCNIQTGGCDRGSDSELCGHGTCLSAANGQHTCLCDEGWGKDNANPAACTVDIDECADVRTPRCHAGVQCLNIPGGYLCGPCPLGYTGNGHVCNDIDECASVNGGCSLDPIVECTNTLGSYRCGSCPAGYSGNGQFCIWFGECRINNGGCSPQADCTDAPGITRTCRCQAGWTGSGEGANGCRLTSGTQPPAAQNPCANNPCQHGTCFSPPNSSAYTCTCESGWTGHHCDVDINECTQGVCQNGGTCNNIPGSYNCSCDQFHTGQNCETRLWQCGGVLSGNTGSFSFPASLDNYPHNASCAWRINVPLNKIISVVFDRFNLESSTTCAFDYLQLHDGPTASSQMIGKYCGTQLQGQTINTTHNQLYFWFKSDASLHDNGFNLTWQALDPECGGDLRDATHGVIQSPGYPGNYPINRTCVWTIRVVAGFNIHISFSAFDLENHSTCNFDSLEFRDGLLPTDPLVTDGGPFCSDVLPAPFTNEGNELYIKFHSDFSATGQGFQFNWNALESDVTTCGGALNTSDGTFTTPNYPSHYDHNGFCVWTITLPPGERIALTFTVMDLEAQDSCIFDWVKVHDGIDETFPQYGPFCGNQAPAPIISAGNELYIRFHSDSSVSGAGFIATWTTSCGGTYTAPTGVLTSPNFPGFYPISKNCFYTITAPEDRVVKITFDAFSVESGSGEAEANCEFDSLTVYDGATENAPVLRSLCGTVIPQPITSSSSSMLLKFVTDGSINDLGFRANYEFVNSVESGCGGVLTGPSGQIDSPGHPNEYPHGADCVWEIRIDPGSQIRLTFNFFSIESSESCLYDYVMVAYNRSELETSSSERPERLRRPGSSLIRESSHDRFNVSWQGYDGRYCGPVAPPVFTSPDNVMFVRFKADTSIAHEGFTASYVSYNHSWCGDQRRTLPGLITSPEWPAQYPHNRQCIWTIIAPDNHQVALNFTDFRLEAHFNCQYDYVELRNGGFSTSPLIGKFCGSEFTTPIVTQSNRVWIKFASDASNTAPGFRIWYDDAGEGCGADLTATSGRFTSPNFPSPYGRNAECIWTVTVSQGSTISLSFIDIDMESSAGCQYDYVEAIDGLRIGDSQRYCVTDGTLPPPFETTSNVLTVKLRSDGSISGRGFHAAYYADCSGVRLTAHSGVIESPNFPNEYPHNRECTWIIAAPEGNNINVAFSHFYVEDHEDCHYDYLELRDGTTETSPLLGQYCGSTLPPRINSTTNNLFIKFVSDSSLAENGFRLEYATVGMDVVNTTTNTTIVNPDGTGCGRDLTDASGEFTTPNWPNEYPHNRECIWRITVEEGMRINLTITDVNIEFHRDCNYDYLQIRAGDHVDSPELVKMCRDHDSNHTITSISNVLYIKFKADASSAGTGFRAVYSTIPGGCGGRFTALEGSIYSPNFPDNYPHNLDCSWDISVGVTSTVSLTFSEFILENHVNCVFDYVQIIDGFEDNSRLLHTLCGNMTGTSYMSTGRDMRVRLRTDSSAAAKGFQGTYTSGCGGDILVTEDGIITSPHYPNNYDGNTNCTWVLRGAQAVDRITIQFTNMDVELHENCSSDYISIFQGDSTSAPQQGIPLCGDTLPRAITSSGNALTIFFSSDATVSKPGFSLQYSKSASFCGGTFTAPAGAFSTPNYPSAYPLNAECIWYLNTPPGNRIQLVFRAFNLESDSGCDRDYVEIRDGVTQAQLGRYCGASIPTNVTTGNSIIVKFRSNEAVTRSGFLAEYSTANGGDLIGNTGRLSNPTYPRPYPSSQDYIWHIIADQGMNVRINITDMDIEYSSTCIFDYVAFYAGRIEEGSPDPPTTRKLCGSTPPPVFVVTNNVVAIKFHTDISASGRGFALNWIAVPNIITTPDPTLTTPSATCNSELVATETIKNFTSPNFPSNYDNSLNCQWSIQAPSGVVSLTFTSMSLEENTLCLYDRVIILDGLTREIGRICPVNLAQPLNYTSTGSLMTVKFLSDSSVTRPGFVALYSTACGGTLTADSGTIQSPNFPAAYPANQECVWVIQVTIGRQVEYTMNNFNLPQTTNCSGDRLILLNGGNENSPLLLNGSWAYCGGSNSAPPTNFISASRYLYVKFISDGTNSGNTGFSLSYTEKSLECGGHLTLDDDESRSRGNLLSPNYGPSGTIPHNADCEWVIMAPANERIQLDFDDFDLEYHAGCEYDHLRVHDGGTENSAQLASLCGKDQQSSIVSTSNVMYLRLISDNSAFSRGFNITYKIATCGGTITANSGFFMSPNYPLSYPNSIQCDWYINGPTGHYIKFDFQAFELAGAAGDGSCRSADTLTFYDRNIHGNATSVIDQSYCGTTAPTDVRTSDSRAYVKFVSNANAVGTGFKVTFNSSVEECGGRLTAPFGRFTSPNYPGYYAHSRQCYWYITAPEGKKVTLTFDDFQLENNVVCAFDFVDVYNGHFESSPLVGRFCGNLTNHTVSSSGSTMMVQFKTDASVSGFGFAISYNTFEDANCGGLITGQPGQVGHITSPGYSESLDAGRLNMTGVYPARTQCNWRLQAPSTVNSSIVLAFKDDRFDLEYDGDCRHDSLELREGSTVQGRFIGKFCGNGTENLPFAIEGNGRVAIPGTELWVNFVSDATIQRPGFNFTYQFAACGGMLSAPNGIITSPNYPGNYDHNMGCAWEISVAEGMLIQLEIVDFELENHDKCNFDVVNVHNGESVDSPIMAKWCGLKTVGTNVTTQSNKMRIEFLSDFSLSARGFKLRWSTRQSGCGGMLHAQAGTITSPSYPANYPHNVECIWDIVVQEGYQVIFDTSQPFDIESSDGHCYFDYVEFFNVDSDGAVVSLGKHCGRAPPPVIRSETNKLRLKFRSDPWTNAAGFSGDWTVGCGGTYSDEAGEIYSPGYPQNYANNLTCDYTITANPNQFVVLQFDEDNFSLEPNINCLYDFVAVYPVHSNNSAIGKFCGRTAPEPVATEGQMAIRFQTDATNTDRGFKATFSKQECGGNITNQTSGEIKSPTHPVQYIHNMNCTWTITVSANMSVQLKFAEFHLESHSTCNFDWLALYDGPDINSRRIGKYCGDSIPENVQTTGNVLTANFRTDGSVSKDGFRAIFSERHGVLQGCGGVINDTQGVITPVLNANGNYHDNLDCVWNVIVPSDKVIQLNVTGVNIEEQNNCPWDGLELIDGLFAHDNPLTSTICGRNLSVTYSYTTTTNVLRVRFFSDSSINWPNGFMLQFTAVDPLCGGIIYATSAVQTISSPNYPNSPSRPNLNCRWIISSNDTVMGIRITVTDINLLDSSDCKRDYLQLKDDPFILPSGPGQEVLACGTHQPHVFESAGRNAQVNYKYSGLSSLGYKGFSLSYQISTCNRTYDTPSGRVITPGWPNVYHHNLNCIYHINVEIGMRVAMYFKEFELEAQSVCSFDHLEVFDGPSTSSPSLGKFCGNIDLAPIVSSSNQITLHIKTDSSVSKKGFDMSYTSTQTGCGGRLSSAIGNFESHPDLFEAGPVSCEWVVEVTTRLRPNITFSWLDLLTGPSCANGSLEIRDGSSASSPLVGTYCDRIPPAFVGSSNSLYVKLVTNTTLPRQAKFRASYVTLDQHLLTDDYDFYNYIYSA